MADGWIPTIGSGLIAGLVLFAGNWTVSADKNRELDIKMLEIAIGILREDNDDKGKLSAAKGWAVDIINLHSRSAQISEEARIELIDRPLKKVGRFVDAKAKAFGTYDTYSYGSFDSYDYDYGDSYAFSSGKAPRGTIYRLQSEDEEFIKKFESWWKANQPEPAASVTTKGDAGVSGPQSPLSNKGHTQDQQ